MPSSPLSRRTLLKVCTSMFASGSAFRADSGWANDLHLGAAAPPATLVTLEGEKISTADLLGHVIILTFWATWCAPCRDELPLLSSYQVQHRDDGLRVLGFSLDMPDQLADVRKVAQSLSFPVGLFVNSSAPGYGRIWRLPVNFTLNRAGQLVENGWKDKQPSWTAQRLEEVVTPLLAQAHE